ncbi:MAG: hypoxanthine phosphoribosyltransferase [Clostridia bacterium]|jgi:hypoxanthine phosphoribosyltransferase|nr:hypoxanthine phosphoribosyltransferase [Clostridia bacterium]MDE6884818.1 hypoxanthine phosphoribosyltransferase [Clostridia bacterium]
MERISDVLIDEERIAKRVEELGRQIEQDYAGKAPVVVAILKGSIIFYGDLVRKIDLPIKFDTMAVSSYGSGTSSSGNVKIKKDLTNDICGEDVLIIEDIIDSGNTMKALTSLLAHRGAKSIKVCAFLDKPSRRTVDFEADYVGYKIPNEFVVGYGLDYDEKYRNLPYIAILELTD